MVKKLAIGLQILAIALALSSCSSLRPKEFDIRHSLRGKTTEDILSCLGPASKTQETDSLEVWSYERKYCTVNFNFVDGVIKKLSYRGATGMPITDPGRCEAVIQNCVKMN